MTYIIFPEDGTAKACLHNGAPSLEQLQEATGGRAVDVVNMAAYGDGSERRRIDLWVDDEGLLKQDIRFGFGYTYEDSPEPQLLAGPVVVTATDAEGDTVPLTAYEVGCIVLCIEEVQVHLPKDNGDVTTLRFLRTEGLHTLLTGGGEQ